MKFLIPTFLLAFSTAHANLFDSMLTANMPTKETQAYKIKVYGYYDARVYEFATDNGMNCVFLATGGNTNTVTLQCVKKED